MFDLEEEWRKNPGAVVIGVVILLALISRIEKIRISSIMPA